VVKYTTDPDVGALVDAEGADLIVPIEADRDGLVLVEATPLAEWLRGVAILVAVVLLPNEAVVVTCTALRPYRQEQAEEIRLTTFPLHAVEKERSILSVNPAFQRGQKVGRYSERPSKRL